MFFVFMFSLRLIILFFIKKVCFLVLMDFSSKMDFLGFIFIGLWIDVIWIEFEEWSFCFVLNIIIEEKIVLFVWWKNEIKFFLVNFVIICVDEFLV